MLLHSDKLQLYILLIPPPSCCTPSPFQYQHYLTLPYWTWSGPSRTQCLSCPAILTQLRAPTVKLKYPPLIIPSPFQYQHYLTLPYWTWSGPSGTQCRSCLVAVAGCTAPSVHLQPHLSLRL
ncbi:hypothetical protein DPMN_083590 [Dreissena polymorpha]|uniref:Uncharacterized protein n=1 Tax=Dreissena polymorpha TaxID=45954 RepID=A0A9D4BIE8_DREPO|nr:hypothetical protein DPMN_083590 [Dreissena polymorpha]